MLRVRAAYARAPICCVTSFTPLRMITLSGAAPPNRARIASWSKPAFSSRSSRMELRPENPMLQARTKRPPSRPDTVSGSSGKKRPPRAHELANDQYIVGPIPGACGRAIDLWRKRVPAQKLTQSRFDPCEPVHGWRFALHRFLHLKRPDVAAPASHPRDVRFPVKQTTLSCCRFDGRRISRFMKPGDADFSLAEKLWSRRSSWSGRRDIGGASGRDLEARGRQLRAGYSKKPQPSSRNEVRLHREAAECLAAGMAMQGFGRVAVALPCMARSISERQDPAVNTRGQQVKASFVAGDRTYGARRV